MQDIDFDEIDRAVSSASGKDPVSPSVDIVTPVVESASDAVRVTVSSSRTAPVSASRRGGAGRFMDVVHPSSDMRPQSTAPSPQKESIAIAEPAQSEPEADKTAAFHWPEAAAKTAPIEQAPVLEESILVDEPEDDIPLESPFLTDAKVEKRPLGAFSGNGAESELPLLEDFPAPKATEEKTVEETPLVEPPREAEDAPEETEVAAAPIEVAPAGPTSITQQYEEKPSSTEQSTGSIYDTDAYRKPQTPSGKKSSGALIAVWIAALILIGGGIGAAIYFVFLPMLG